MRKILLCAAVGLSLLSLARLDGPVLAVELNAAFNSIDSPDIRAYIDVLAGDAYEGREAGTRGGRAAGIYLGERFQELDLKPAGENGTYFQEFGSGYRNILGVIDGGDPAMSGQVVVVSAHYDHVGYGTRKSSRGPIGYIHNGADDNASGVAGLLEVAEAFKALGEPPKRSVVFALWDGEEKGLLGSRHWISEPTVPRDGIAFAINVDMIGRMRNRRVEIHGTRSANGLRRLVANRNQITNLTLDFLWDTKKKSSDHHSFYTAGIPFLMLHTGLHEDFHRPSDDADKINHEGAEQVTKLLFSIALEIANQPKLHAFRSQCRREAASDRRKLESALPPRPPRLGVWWERRTGERPGLYLTRILPDLPAERAGLRVGDRLVRFDGRPIEDEDMLRKDVLAAQSPATVVVERAVGETQELSVELDGEPLRLGISWREDEAEPGTLILSRVVPGSAAHLAGLQVGDRIYEIDGRDFGDDSEFLHLLSELPDSFGLLVERRGQLRTVTLDLPPVDIGAE
jgi:hypothetical protein